MKKTLIIVVSLVILLFIVLPFIEIKKDSKLLYIKYSDDISFFEDYTCYDESITYNQKKDISINNIKIKKYFMFYLFELEYEEGNLCDTEYLLEESYIEDFINNSKITYNSHNIDIKSLIKDKKAIVSNTKYFGNDYDKFIEYKLNNKENIMYVFYEEDLLILQVGFSDEGPKFIAYK